MSNLALYIGVDHREPEATIVAEHSARMYASRPLSIYQLEHLDLRRRNWLTRPWRIDETGIMQDERDGKPFSTQFAHSRFLTPLLAKEAGHDDWALFVDSDILVLDDLWEILKEADPRKTVHVVPHNYHSNVTKKMDGQPQSNYNRKLWSAVMLWNLRSSKLPTFEQVNYGDGGSLHRFEWLNDSDIGHLNERWHFIPNASPTTELAKKREAEGGGCPISLVHMTLGVPGMADRQSTGWDDDWKGVLADYYRTHY